MKRKIKYDVFISYKRRGGTPWAELLFLALAKIKKKRVFIDRDGLGGGTFKKWKTAINEAIESSANVIVVVFPGIQDVIKDKDDFFKNNWHNDKLVKPVELTNSRGNSLLGIYHNNRMPNIIMGARLSNKGL